MAVCTCRQTSNVGLCVCVRACVRACVHTLMQRTNNTHCILHVLLSLGEVFTEYCPPIMAVSLKVEHTSYLSCWIRLKTHVAFSEDCFINSFFLFARCFTLCCETEHNHLFSPIPLPLNTAVSPILLFWVWEGKYLKCIHTLCDALPTTHTTVV